MTQSLARFMIAVSLLAPSLEAQTPTDTARWQATAARVTITRDDWGIAHVHGTTDADAVFGMIYAQAEDDFNRVETNYLNALGRLAEAEGEAAIWSDLRMKLFIDPDRFGAVSGEPGVAGGADGRLGRRSQLLPRRRTPTVKPRVIRQFEPWMALAFSEGSIGGDIERVNLGALRAFYGRVAPPARARSVGKRIGTRPAIPAVQRHRDRPIPECQRTGAPPAINPHTSFYFRSELQMTSDEGLDAYGAVTWGQFFIYQGFNGTAGWMHTSSGVDNIDEYLETVEQRGGRWRYRHDGACIRGDGRDRRTHRTGDEMATRRSPSTARRTARSSAPPTARG